MIGTSIITIITPLLSVVVYVAVDSDVLREWPDGTDVIVDLRAAVVVSVFGTGDWRGAEGDECF
jgi:hypothetical protein